VDEGLIEVVSGRMQLTRRAMLISDAIFSELV
jgi:hypothetical protein